MGKLDTWVAADFEVFYCDKTYSVSRMGLKEFCTDERFHAYLVSMYSPALGIRYVGDVESAPWEKINGIPIVFHNIQFDRSVFLRCQELGQIPKHIEFPEWNCTMALAASLQIRRTLRNVAQHLLGIELSKEVRGAASGKRWPEDFDEEEQKQMLDYALKDSIVCGHVYHELKQIIPETEQFVARHTDNLPFKGIRVDRSRLESGMMHLQKIVDETLEQVPGGMSIPKLYKQIRDAGGTPPPTTNHKEPGFQVWSEKNPDHVHLVENVQKLRSANKTLELLRSIRGRLDKNDIFDARLKYYGAEVTGRWSGAGGVNMQNLPKKPIEGVDVRSLFTPRPGHKFVIADLAQIEPRCLAWTINDDKFLDAVRGGTDIYEAHARNTMGYEDPRPLAEVDKALRNLAKVRVLALSYGMGWKKFQQTAKSYGIDLTDSQAKAQVTQFRKSNHALTAYWVAWELECRRAVNGATSAPGLLELEMPSGRVMKYYNLRREGRSFVGNILADDDNRIAYLYGGLLCENATQGMARDVMAHAIHQLEMAGHAVLWSVHDEVIVEVPEAHAEAAQESIRRIMTTPPSWAPDLPLDVSSSIADHYEKD